MKNSDVLFVQFIMKTFLFPDSNAYGLANGFSDTWDLCKSKGDFLWIDLDMGNRIKIASETIRHCNKIEFPIDKGTAYVSCTLTPQIYQVYSWAMRYPNVKFIAGGPVVDSTQLYWDKEKIPTNLTLYEGSVEEYFNVPNFSYKWHIDPPKYLLNKKYPIYFTYNLSNTCYWGQCNFCQFTGQKERFRTEFNFEFNEIFPENEFLKMMSLYSPSITPWEIENVLPNLPLRDDFFYRIFLRGTKRECSLIYNILKNDPSKHNIFNFYIGVEFPSNRMIKEINKGISVEEMTEAINLLTPFGNQISIGLILGWPTLSEDDLIDLEKFLSNIKNKNVILKIHKLFCRTYTKAHEDYEARSKWNTGPFYQGFNPLLSNEVIKINDRANEIIENSGIPLMNNYKFIREIENNNSLKQKYGKETVV